MDVYITVDFFKFLILFINSKQKIPIINETSSKKTRQATISNEIFMQINQSIFISDSRNSSQDLHFYAYEITTDYCRKQFFARFAKFQFQFSSFRLSKFLFLAFIEA
jgi:uncharacterized protein (UPF0216 family)